MSSIAIKRGGSEDIYINTKEVDAISASFIVGKINETPKFIITSPFIEGENGLEAHFNITGTHTDIDVDAYKYQYNIEYTGGEIEKYPSDDGCLFEDVLTGANLPDFYITPSLDAPEEA